MRKRAVRVAIVAIAVQALVLTPLPSPVPARAAAPGNEVTITVQGGSLTNVTAQPPALTPSFNPAVFDYALRCQTGVNSLQLTLTSNSVITVGGQSGTTVTVPVNLVESEAAIVTAPDSGNPATTDSYWIRCLPHDFPPLSVSTPGSPSAGLYYTGTLGPVNGSSPYAMVLDEHGTPVWYQKVSSSAINVEPLAGDVIAWAPNLGPGVGATPNGAWNLFHLDNQSTSSLPAPIEPTDAHELLPMSNGHFMMIATPLMTTATDLSFLGPDFATVHQIVDCVLQEVDANGNLVWSWDASQHVALSETVASENVSPPVGPINVNGQAAADVYHCNSIDLDPSVADPSNADLLLSMRHTSSLYRISRSGPILWKVTGMGNTHVGADNEPVLTPSDGFSGQHDARFRPNGDVTIYDDQTWLHGTARGVEYSIDTTHKTATDVWQYAPAGGATSLATGSFRRSADGTDNVVGWGFRPGSGFTEVDGGGNPLLSVSFPNGETTYRALKFAKTSNMLALLRSTTGFPQQAPVNGFTMDGFGSVYHFGSVAGATSPEAPPSWPGWLIARGLAVLPNHSGGYVVDGWGGVHPFGSAPALSGNGTYWPGWDIVRGIVVDGAGGGYVLDGLGGVHNIGSAPPVTITGYWPSWDIAVALVLRSDGHSGWVMDGLGGLHGFGIPGDVPSAQPTGYWPTWDIARALVLSSDSGGYTLDGLGGLHPFGTAGPISSTSYWPGWDIARSISLYQQSPPAGYLLDGWGGIHPVGAAAGTTSPAYTPGQDVFRAVGVTS